jgi:hypothetical protein
LASDITISPDLTSFNSQIAGLTLEVKAIVAEALYEQMLDVMDDAKEICPVDTGALRESGTVERARISTGGISIELNFGVHPPIPYAFEQHENLNLFHPRGKEAKFLEKPLMAWWSGGGPSEVIEDVEEYLDRRIV